MSIANLAASIEQLKVIVEDLRKECAITSAQSNEILPVVVSIANRLDLLGAANVSEPVVAKAPPKKRAAKKVVVEEPASAEENEPAEVVVPKKKVTKKTAAAKAAAEPEVKSDDDAPPAKPVGKKTAKKPEAKTTKRPMNVMEYFKVMYTADNTAFDRFLTPKVKKEIAATNKKEWADLDEDELETKKRQAYYQYVKANNESELQALKINYIEAQNAESLEIVDKDANE